MPTSTAARPDISVIVPFQGTREDARALISALRPLARTDRDELIVIDNSPAAVVEAQDGIRVRRAPLLGSSYYARNVGAASAANEWLLFTDADCRPHPSLLDLLFARPVGSGCGLIAGEVEAAARQRALVARWHRARGHLAVQPQLARGPAPTAGTANLAVRKRVWEELGGFHEVLSGADYEFCWRAGERGWSLTYRPEARVEHLHPEDLRTMWTKAQRYGSGQLWVNRRYPRASPPPSLARQLTRAVAGIAVWTCTGRLERALFKGIDGLFALAFSRGYWLGDNRPRRLLHTDRRKPLREVGFADRFPARQAKGAADRCDEAGSRCEALVVAVERPREVDLATLRRSRIAYLEDEPPLERVRSLCWLALLHPLRCSADVAGRDEGEVPLRVLARAVRLLDAATGARAKALPGGEPIAARVSRLAGATPSQRPAGG